MKIDTIAPVIYHVLEEDEVVLDYDLDNPNLTTTEE